MQKLVMTLAFLCLAVPAGATEAGWALLRDGGQVVLMRHAYAPGSGATREAPGGDSGDCIGEASLSDRGRQQARRIGALFAARAAPVDEVLTSRYCRCVETARLAFGAGAVSEFAPLNALGAPGADKERQAAETLARIRAHHGLGNLVLVTDLDNIAALTGATAREGEALVVRPDGERLHVAAHIVFN
jgi:phosphohistidine phosphatase SixA